MRLGQLARQLSIKPDEIVNFLSSQKIAIDIGNNARIDDSYVELILQRFAADDDTIKEEIIRQPELSDAEQEPLVSEEITPGPESAGETIPEVIKAPKIELPGLRVLGKIELPEKKKPEAQVENEPPEERPASPPRRVQRYNPPRPQKSSVALAREREEREKKQRQDEQREKEKQRKTEFYMKRLKPQAPTKAARLVDGEFIEMPPLEAERPKTWWGRFKRWLNT